MPRLAKYREARSFKVPRIKGLFISAALYAIARGAYPSLITSYREHLHAYSYIFTLLNLIFITSRIKVLSRSRLSFRFMSIRGSYNNVNRFKSLYTFSLLI
jgi:hypothetical protein